MALELEYTGSLVQTIINAIKADRENQRRAVERALGDLAYLVLDVRRDIPYALFRELFVRSVSSDLRGEKLTYTEHVRLLLSLSLERREPDVYEPHPPTIQIRDLERELEELYERRKATR